MTPQEQLDFVYEYSRDICKQISRMMNRGDIPPSWTQDELSVLLARLHKDASSVSAIIQHPTRQRACDFRRYLRILLPERK